MQKNIKNGSAWKILISLSSELSGGIQRRAAIARVPAYGPGDFVNE